MNLFERKSLRLGLMQRFLRQKKELLPRLVNGEGIAALGITEPNAGSDLSCLETTAKRKRDVFILNGSKT